MRTSSGSAPTSSQARCFAPTGRGCSRCTSPIGRRTTTPSQVIGWWSPEPRGVLPAGRCWSQQVAAAVVSKDANDGRPGLRRRGGRVRRPKQVGSLDQRRHPTCLPPAARAGVGSQRRDVAGTTSWSVGSTASASAGSSPASRCSTDAPTRPRSPWCGWSASCPPTVSRRFLDVQWVTDHLASLGAVEIPRSEYLQLGFVGALKMPLPAVWGAASKTRRYLAVTRSPGGWWAIADPTRPRSTCAPACKRPLTCASVGLTIAASSAPAGALQSVCRVGPVRGDSTARDVSSRRHRAPPPTGSRRRGHRTGAGPQRVLARRPAQPDRDPRPRRPTPGTGSSTCGRPPGWRCG